MWHTVLPSLGSPVQREPLGATGVGMCCRAKGMLFNTSPFPPLPTPSAVSPLAGSGGWACSQPPFMTPLWHLLREQME